MNPILVGVDGSEQAMKAARMAADLAVACQAKLILVYVVPPIAAGAEWMLLPPDLYEADFSPSEVARFRTVLAACKRRASRTRCALSRGEIRRFLERAEERLPFGIVVIMRRAFVDGLHLSVRSFNHRRQC